MDEMWIMVNLSMPSDFITYASTDRELVPWRTYTVRIGPPRLYRAGIIASMWAQWTPGWSSQSHKHGEKFDKA